MLIAILIIGPDWGRTCAINSRMLYCELTLHKFDATRVACFAVGSIQARDVQVLETMPMNKGKIRVVHVAFAVAGCA